MSLFDFLKKKQRVAKGATDFTNNIIEQPPTGTRFQEKCLTYVEKERITVQRVSIKDMQQLTSLPYRWNSSIKKMIDPHAHPFAYMDLCGVNINIAKSELSKINVLLANAHFLSSMIPKNLQIPVDDIVFKPSKHYGYTRLMCTPHTYSGDLSEHPASLSFMTDMDSDVSTTHGDLFYSQTGKIAKANIYFWRRHRGHFFYYDTVDGELVLSRVEVPNTQGENEIIYKGKHILEWEANRAKEEQDYIWLQRAFPGKCPKTLTGYRRMKTQNTRNYQTLKQFAAEHGKEI